MMIKDLNLWSDRFYYSKEAKDLNNTKEDINSAVKEFLCLCGHSDDLPYWLNVDWLEKDYCSRINRGIK